MGVTSWFKRALRRRPARAVHRRVRKATVAFCLLTEDQGFAIGGSGVLVDRSGVVLTAAHVMHGLATDKEKFEEEEGKGAVIRVLVTKNPRVEYDDEAGALAAQADATFTSIKEWAHHSELDLAVVKTTLDRTSERVTHLKINDHRAIRRGEQVGACGYPYGLDPHEGKAFLNSCLTGHVSGIAPTPEPSPELVQHYLLQMPVNPGNSGGPVFSPRTGEVCGLVSRRFQPGGIPSGLCIAVPVHGTTPVIREAAAL